MRLYTVNSDISALYIMADNLSQALDYIYNDNIGEENTVIEDYRNLIDNLGSHISLYYFMHTYI